jgi:hypothetical protein
LNESFPDSERIRIIGCEDKNCSSSNTRSTDEYRSVPFEVPIPLLGSRIEEPNQLTRMGICPSYIRAFVAIAVEAGVGEVL